MTKSPLPRWDPARKGYRFCALLFVSGLCSPIISIGAADENGKTNPAPAATAAALTGMDSPTGTLGLLVAADAVRLWESPPASSSSVPAARDKGLPIDPDLLAGVEDRTPVRSAAENYNEARAYTYLLLQAHATPVAAFVKSARRDVTFAHLFEEPNKYRGQVIHLEGRLARLRRFDAPSLAIKQGVPVLYEGWIFGEGAFNNPSCVIITEVPPSVPLGESLQQHVAFEGYFFKRYRYKAGDGWRDAPLLIGHALRDLQPASPAGASDGSFALLVIPGVLTVLGMTVVLVVGLHWWFRRGDRRVHDHLLRSRTADFVEPGTEESRVH